MEGMLNYYIPEDGDSLDHMNVIPLPRIDQLRLQHVKKIFPLPGTFHFRFKTAFEGTYIWLDMTNDNDIIPMCNGLYISKVVRMQDQDMTRPVEHVQTSKGIDTVQKTPDLIETASVTGNKSGSLPIETPKQMTFHDDLVGLLSDPIPASSPSSGNPMKVNNHTNHPNLVQQKPPSVSTDPFNLFMGSTSNSSNPPTSMSPPPMQVPLQSTTQSTGMNGMNISQMHMGMNNHNMKGPGMHPQNSFHGLEWQGMGGQRNVQEQMHQQRNPSHMNMQGNQMPRGQW